MDTPKLQSTNSERDGGPLSSAGQNRPADAARPGGADISLSVRSITKVYKLYDSPRHRFNETFHPFRKKYHRDFYALRDVSFDVERGQTVGIIGRNGSGKSTLLQIITGVLTPTSGSVMANGRISALLELGSGFNPEFTGTENVFLSGSLMGFTYDEIGKKLDAIVEFADIGEFINQPMKIYSSGMYVRLAFAVSSCVDPDILIVDEALSVGDEAFQRKCMARLESLKERGCSILFVSHSSQTVVQISDRVLLLEGGNLFLEGKPRSVVSVYHKMLYQPNPDLDQLRHDYLKMEEDTVDGEPLEQPGTEKGVESEIHYPSDAEKCCPKDNSFFDPHLISQSAIEYPSKGAEISDVRIVTPDGRTVNNLVRGCDYIFTFTASFQIEVRDVLFGSVIKTTNGIELGGMLTHPFTEPIEKVAAGQVLYPRFHFRCNLLPNMYFFTCGIVRMENQQVDFLKRRVDVLLFRVIPEEELKVNQIFDFLIRSSVVVES